MSDDHMIKILIAFFNDEFENDAIMVADWLDSHKIDVDGFLQVVHEWSRSNV